MAVRTVSAEVGNTVRANAVRFRRARPSKPPPGFNQAIELCAETLANVKFIQEKRLISKYFEEISQDTGKFCFGISDTLKGLEMGCARNSIAGLRSRWARFGRGAPCTLYSRCPGLPRHSCSPHSHWNSPQVEF